MSDRPETTDDIIREMRDLGALDEQCGDMIPRSLQALGLRTYAGRLEAARKRETDNAAAMRLCDELIQAAYDADICSPYDLAQRVRKIKDAIGPSPHGNASALREALIQCELFLGNVSRHAHPTLNPGDKCTACDGVDELRGMVVRALAAPPRNCDLCEDWLALYVNFRPPKGMREMPPDWVDAVAAFCKWLKAEGREASNG